MVGAGIKATKSYSFLAKEVGGANNLGFLRRDCHNFLRTVRKEIIEAGDGQNVLFKMFEDELSLGTELSCVETNHLDNEFTFSLVGGDSNKVHIVYFNRSNLTICFDCKLFETLGLLCCHALRVFLVNNVNMIPDKYISSRWRRDAKKRLTCANSCQFNEKSTHTLRMS
ncbi:hypothetical protein ACB092_12G136400 [Castanea dentata]